MSDSLQPYELLPTRLLYPWDFPGKNTGVGCHALLQGIFPTQGWNPSANTEDVKDVSSVPESRKFSEEGNGNPLQYSCLENPMDREAWQAIVHEVTKSWTLLSN